MPPQGDSTLSFARHHTDDSQRASRCDSDYQCGSDEALTGREAGPPAAEPSLPARRVVHVNQRGCVELVLVQDELVQVAQQLFLVVQVEGPRLLCQYTQPARPSVSFIRIDQACAVWGFASRQSWSSPHLLLQDVCLEVEPDDVALARHARELVALHLHLHGPRADEVILYVSLLS